MSCIYGFGSPDEYGARRRGAERGRRRRRDRLLRHLVEIYYDRNDMDVPARHVPRRGATRLKIFPAYARTAIRVQMFGDEVERITEIDPLTGEILDERAGGPDLSRPSTSSRRSDKLTEAIGTSRTSWRSGWRASGPRASCSRRSGSSSAPTTTWRCCARWATAPGSRTTRATSPRRKPGQPPWTLLDYFPDDFLLVIDESHMTIPQIRGMYNGDRARKEVLVEYGFRLPSAPGQPPAAGSRSSRST